MKVLVLFFAMIVGTTTYLCAQDQQDFKTQDHQDFKNYGLVQAGATSSSPKYTLGVDFGQDIGSNLQLYIDAGWMEDKGNHLTGGVKVLMLPSTVRVRPYVRGGLGLISVFTPLPDSQVRFLAEAGAGVAFAVGRQGYIDIGYGYMKPHEFSGFGRLYTGFGVRF